MTKVEIIKAITQKFRTFGGGRSSTTNPVAAALKDEPAMFAAGVSVEEIVDFVREQPIDAIIFCPNCHMQHIDRPDEDGDCECECSFNDHDWSQEGAEPHCRNCACQEYKRAWDNPPHKSHLCRTDDGGCGITFRFADIPTNGVDAIKTRGEKDTWPEVKR
jgi:hypothetical protein